jgi:hypothetical protein
MASYYRFATELGWWSGTLDAFVRDRNFGIDAWKSHVEGWLDRVDGAAAFTMVRYEDLLADTAGTMRALYAQLGYCLDGDMLGGVVTRSSAERMRADEALFNAMHPRLIGFSFVRKGEMSAARVRVTDGAKAYIAQRAGSTIERLGYIV